MSIELDTSIPITAQKAGEKLKLLHPGPNITAATVRQKLAPTLTVTPRPEKVGSVVNYRSEAKRIWSWMAWYLPAGTVSCLRDLINAESTQ